MPDVLPQVGQVAFGVEEFVELRRDVTARRLVAQLELGDAWVWIVLDEAVLYRVVSGRSVMREQLARLLELVERPRLQLQILPFESADPAAMGGSCTLLLLPEGREAAYEQGIVFGRLIEDRDEVMRRAVLYDRLQANALSPAASAELIREVMEERYPCGSPESS